LNQSDPVKNKQQSLLKNLLKKREKELEILAQEQISQSLTLKVNFKMN